MTLKGVVYVSILATMNECLGSSKFFKLRYEGKVIAMRAVYLDPNTRDTLYYDFYTNRIKDKSLQEYITSISSTMSILELNNYGNLIATEEEYKRGYAVEELEKTEDIENIVKKIREVYTIRGIMESMKEGSHV